ncbi:glycogen debranching N-terminal domain-containing protein [Streptosporangium lutulentum]
MLVETLPEPGGAAATGMTAPETAYRPQPLLHDLVSTVLAPTTALGDADGQIRPAGVQGLFHADSRALSQVKLEVDGREPEAVGYAPDGPGGARFVSLPRWLGDRRADPTVRINRTRRVTPGALSEHVEIVSTASVAVTAAVTLKLSCDFAPIEVVKSGGDTVPAPAVISGPGELSWRSGRIGVTVTGEDAKAEPGETAWLRWEVTLPPGGRTVLRWNAVIDDPEAVVVAPARAVEWSRPQVVADHRLTRLLEQSLDDLRSLRLAEASAPGDTFLGAGVPWFLTLFGRDSIWAARMLLPSAPNWPRAPCGFSRAAREPGSTPTRARRPARSCTSCGGTSSPCPATTCACRRLLRHHRRHPLWISLLHDAWRWGLPEHQVAALMPYLEAALGWLGEHTDAGGGGFVKYLGTRAHGLANQGWKDSGDAVRFRDGHQAEPPIALVEVQGYAYQAARHGAALLEAFGRPGAARWRDRADTLAERFRARFWVDGPHGRFPALALDGNGRPVDALTSNIGHLLGTGLLSDEESAAVAELLVSPEMADGFGLRTMSSREGGFNPMSYHCGSIWAHDTAIVIAGLARAGFGAQAGTLAEGLLAAGETFDYRLPELFACDARGSVG